MGTTENNALNSYRSISELPSMDGALPSSTDLLMLSKEDNTNAGYISYKVSIHEIAPCISSDILAEMKSNILDGIKNLAYKDKADLEYRGEYALTSFPLKALSTSSAKVAAKTETGKLYAISAVSWNDNLTLTATQDVELTQLSANAYNEVLATLDQLGIRDGVEVITPEDESGLSLAQIKLKGNDWCTIYSGDPSELVSVEPIATTTGLINAGEREIARIKFGGTNKTVTLSNSLSVNAVSPSYNENLRNTGEVIGYINGVPLRNNLSIASDQDAKTMSDISYGQHGDNIARINGKYIKNGLLLTKVDNTYGSKVIANINGTDIHNGIVVADRSLIGDKICNIDGKDLYNNLKVIDHTGGGNGKVGDCIAQINDVSVYNGIVITVDESLNQTYINGKPTKGGIKLGTATPKTNAGNVIAELETSNGTVYIYNGINANSLSNDIVSRLEAEIADLRSRYESDISWLRNELNKYMLLNTGAKQVVTGPITFNQTIDGNITHADYATKAQWS